MASTLAGKARLDGIASVPAGERPAAAAACSRSTGGVWQSAMPDEQVVTGWVGR